MSKFVHFSFLAYLMTRNSKIYLRVGRIAHCLTSGKTCYYSVNSIGMEQQNLEALQHQSQSLN